MVKTTENGALVAPFLMKCYEMVDDESTDAMIAWTSNGDSFIIHDVTKFEGELLPKYFKHNNFSSFVRQLNIYGFKKIDTDRWEFANEKFLKGQKHLLPNIDRRKNYQAATQRKPSQRKETNPEAHEENPNDKLRKEVEILKNDKIALAQELSKLRQHQENSQSRLLFLREQLKGMELNQQQMLSFIVMAMQNPGFFVQVLQPKENSWRMTEAGNRVLEQVTDEDDRDFQPSDGVIVKYQPPVSAVSPEAPRSDDNSMDYDGIDSDYLSLFLNELSTSDSHEEPPGVVLNLPGDDTNMEELLNSCSMSENVEDGEYDDDDDDAEFFGDGTVMESFTNGDQVKSYDALELVSETPNEVHESRSLETVTEQMGESGFRI